MMKPKKMKRKEIIVGLQGILAASGLSRGEKEIIVSAIERLETDKQKITELRAAFNSNVDDIIDAFWETYFC